LIRVREREREKERERERERLIRLTTEDQGLRETEFNGAFLQHSILLEE